MKYQNDPTKPDYNPSPQESFRFSYNAKYGVCLLFVSVISLVHIFFADELKGLNSYGIWFSGGAAVIMMIYGAYNMIKFFSLKKDQEKLDELYKQYSDERNTLIREKTASDSFTVTMYIICAAIVVFAYINTLTAFVLAGLLLAMFLVRLILKMYYEKKY
ncbi:MAG: hypothetical protein K2K44_07500 [Oscillospiraceae bacterium]|nr:hypothetical protein [Oscillospiraceae bacterium]